MRKIVLVGLGISLASAGCDIGGGTGDPSVEGPDAAQVAERGGADSSGGSRDRIASGSVKAALTVGERIKANFSPDMLAALAAGQPQDVIVEVRAKPKKQLKGQLFELTGLRDQLLNKVRGATPKRTFKYVPMMVVEVRSRDTLAQLLEQNEVVEVFENRHYQPLTAGANLSLVGQPAAVGATPPADGAGTTVVVVDTGVDFAAYPTTFGNCTAGVGGACRLVESRDMVAALVGGQPPVDAGDDDAASHGTLVAGILAEMAPQTDIVSLDVGSGGGTTITSADVMQAVQWAIDNQDELDSPIVAINMSFGGSGYGISGNSGSSPVTCDATAAETAIITAARNVGIITVAAAGNDAKTNALSYPACISKVVSVGAVFADDTITQTRGGCTNTSPNADTIVCSSNSASFLTMYAPGAGSLDLPGAANVGLEGGIGATGLGALTGYGTSFAVPHVTGAIAMLRGLYPLELNEHIIGRMTATGADVTDARTGAASRVKPRLDIDAAAVECVGYFGTPTGDPSVINSDGELLAAGGDITVPYEVPAGCGALPAADDGLTPTAPGDTITVTVASNEDGPQRELVLRGAGGVELTFAQLGDVAAPTATTFSIGSAAGAAEGIATTDARLYFEFTDGVDGSGIDKVCFSNVATCPSAGWITYTTGIGTLGATTGYLWTLSAVEGTKTVSVWLKDNQGNISATAIKDTIILDTRAPAPGTLKAFRQPDSGLKITLSGFTDSGVGVKEILLKGIEGTTAPASLCASGGVTALNRTLTRAVDEENIQPGEFSVLGTGEVYYTVADDDLMTATRYSFRACAVDYLDQTSVGSVVTSYPTKDDTDPPEPTGSLVITGQFPVDPNAGTVTLEDDLVYTSELAVGVGGLTAATDAIAVCVSGKPLSTNKTVAASEGVCPTTWVTIVGGSLLSSMATLAAVDGVRTVYVKYMDLANNESLVSKATIKLDRYSPRPGVLTAVAASTDPVTANTNRIYWTPAVDAGSGVNHYKLVYRISDEAAGLTPNPDCEVDANTILLEDGITTPYTASNPYVHDDLTPGALYRYRLCAEDNAGRSNPVGAYARSRARADYDAPAVAAFTMKDSTNGSAVWSNGISFDADVTASGATKVCITSTNSLASCTDSKWQVYPLDDSADSGANQTATLAVSDGTKTMYVFAKDDYDNVSASLSDTINLDRSPPGNGTFTATGGTGQVTLTWSAATSSAATGSQVGAGGQFDPGANANARSGANRRIIVAAEGTSAPPCILSEPDNIIYDSDEGALTEASFVHMDLDDGTTYAYRMCVYDLAGTRGTGVTKTAKTSN